MESGTRNILIGVGVAVAVCALFCCFGSAAFFFIASSSDSSSGPTSVSAPASDGAAGKGERWPSRDFESDYSAARKAGWKVSKPKGKTPKPLAKDHHNYVTLRWGLDYKPSSMLKHSAERSAFATALVLAGGKPETFADKSGFEALSPATRAVYLGSFANCGPLADFAPTRWTQPPRSAASKVWVGSWLTTRGCTLETAVKKMSFGGTDAWVPTEVRLYRPATMPHWIVRSDPDSFKKSEAARLAKKHGKDIGEKVRKARRAGMKAEHYYPSETIGNIHLIRDVLPKAKVSRSVDVKTHDFGGNEYFSIGYDLTYEGQKLRYRVFFNNLGQFTGKSRDRRKLVIAGETLELEE